MNTSEEKLFNDGLYGVETLDADECAQITERIREDEPVFPNWRPIYNGVPMTLTTDGFHCGVTGAWKSRTSLEWIDKKTDWVYV